MGARFGPRRRNEGAAGAGEGAPELLGHERHEGVQQAQHPVEHVHEHRPRLPLRPGVAAVRRRLGGLDVPVGKVGPGKVVEGSPRLSKVELLAEGGHPVDGPVEVAQDPAVGEREALPSGLLGKIDAAEFIPLGIADVLKVEEDELAAVPNLVDKVPRVGHAVHVEVEILSRGCPRCQGKAEGVGAVLRDGVERVDDIAEGFAHLAALLVPHEPVEEDGAEGRPARQLDPHHDHARDPEEEDVVPGLHHGRGVEPPQVLGGLVGPPEGGKRPQPRREPRVEHVLLLGEHARGAVSLIRGPPRLLGVSRHDVAVAALRGDLLLAVKHVPDGDPVAPPQLPADAPVLDVLQPVVVDLLEALRDDPDVPVGDGLERRLGERLHPHKPLLAHHRLDHLAAALRPWHAGGVGLAADHEALRLHVRPEGLAALVAVHPRVTARRGVHRRVLVHDVEGLEAKAFADLVVVAVVPRSDLEAPRAKLHVDVLVGDDGDPAAAAHRDDRFLPDEVPVALVLGVDAERRVAEDRLGTGGGHRDGLVAAGDGVAEEEQLGLLLRELDLEVADRCLERGAPVHHVAAPVDEPLVVQPGEGLVDGARKLVAEREGLAAPIARGAEAAQLAGDGAAVLALPLPDLLLKGLAAHPEAALALLCEHLLHDHLCRDPCVVCPGQPQRWAPPSPCVPRHDVLEGGKHGVAHVELPSHVGRRHGHHERLAVLLQVWLEIPLLLPPSVNFVFSCEVKIFRKVFCRPDSCLCIRRAHGRDEAWCPDGSISKQLKPSWLSIKRTPFQVVEPAAPTENDLAP
mmetsp:Transcript_18696/g.44683  ORF Transcript_18696/g.44683 Transcript_18696/m.44683 type:complete len:798 (+) Transcript_18696:625-3018(+)